MFQPLLEHPVSWNSLTKALAYFEGYCVEQAQGKTESGFLEFAKTLLTSFNPNHPLIDKFEQSNCH